MLTEMLEDSNMKRKYVSFVAFAIATCCFLFSCGNKESKNIGALKFDSVKVARTEHLFGDNTKPACKLTISFTYPTQSSDVMLKDSLMKQFVISCFGEQYVGKTPSDILKQYADAYANDYRHDLEPTFLQESKKLTEDGEHVNTRSWYAYYKQLDSKILYYEKNLLIYKINYSENTGGAHGMYTTTFVNFDLSRKKMIHLGDLFEGEYQDELSDCIWDQLMTDHHAKSRDELENLGYGVTNEITATENFYLSDKGITFYYNVYDIAPYAMGPVSVTIPFSKVTRLLANNPILKNFE